MFPRGRGIGVPAAFCDSLVRMIAERVALPEHVGLSTNRVLDDPAEATSLASPGRFGWAGAFGTNSWIDPTEQMVGVLLVQRQPGVIDPELRAIWPRIQITAYQAIDD